MGRFRKLKSGAYYDTRSKGVVSKAFVSHEMSRVRHEFRGAERYRPSGSYKTMSQIIREVRDLDRVDDIETLEERGVFGLIQKLSAEGRSVGTP